MNTLALIRSKLLRDGASATLATIITSTTTGLEPNIMNKETLFLRSITKVINKESLNIPTLILSQNILAHRGTPRLVLC